MEFDKKLSREDFVESRKLQNLMKKDDCFLLHFHLICLSQNLRLVVVGVLWNYPSKTYVTGWVGPVCSLCRVKSRYRSIQSNKFDGVHMYGPSGEKAYTASV